MPAVQKDRECACMHYCPRLYMAELSGTERGRMAAEPDALTIHLLQRRTHLCSETPRRPFLHG